MNENLNLVEILKDCPIGTKLYSTIHGEVESEKYRTDGDYPIVYNYRNKTGGLQSDSVTEDGRFNFCSYGECILFPAKDQRDWSKFNIKPKFDINTLQPFDKVLVRDCNSHKWNCNLFDRLNKTSQYLFVCIVDVFNQCVPYNDETKHLIGTTAKPPEKYITWKE